MLFNSIDFLVFFPIVVLIYLIIPKKIRYMWLLITSLYFYMCWNVKYIFLLLLSIVTTWVYGWIVYNNSGKRRKIALVMCIVINLGILFVFKYLDFFYNTCNSIINIFGFGMIEKKFDILLPVGISFYTFQALGYIFDVYRGKIEPEKNFLRYTLFVSFFPQLVAGPIERSENLLKQVKEIERKKVWDYENITSGLTLMIWGLFVKMVISDRVAILVNDVFNNYYMYGTIELVFGAIGFALQIYCDFMGYSTVAIGAAKVLGFQLMENFETPYFSKSISEFWRRWHISLSTWFKDYVYIPLGGNRCSKKRKYFNLMVTFGISGLWHGANWTFVVWGALHGMFQIIEDTTKPFREKLYSLKCFKKDSFSFKLGQVITTFVLVDFTWIFFRAESIEKAIDYYRRMFTKWNPWTLFDGTVYTLGLEPIEINILLLSLLALFLVELIREYAGMSMVSFLKEQCILFRWMVILGLIGAIVVFGIYGIKFDSTQFIYFQF